MNHIGSRSINCFSLVYYTHHQTKINDKEHALAYTMITVSDTVYMSRRKPQAKPCSKMLP